MNNYNDFIFNFISNRYKSDELKYYSEIENIIDKVNFLKFLLLMPDDYFNSNSKLERLVKIYHSNEELIQDIKIEDIENENIINNFKMYILDFNRDKFNINSREQLINIKEIRDDYYFNQIQKSNNINKIKSYLTQLYYGMRFGKFYDKVLEIQEVTMNPLTSDEFSNDEYLKNYFICEVSSMETKSELISYYERFKYFHSGDIFDYFDKIDIKLKGIYDKYNLNKKTNIKIFEKK